MAVIRVQHKRTTRSMLTQTSLSKQLTGVFGTFHLMHFIGDELAAVDILDHIPVEKTTSDSAGQPSDIPTPHLIGSVSAMRRQYPAFRGFGSAATHVLISGF
ncbi:hypothetical protein D3C75_901830 [compost metagenome]